MFTLIRSAIFKIILWTVFTDHEFINIAENIFLPMIKQDFGGFCFVFKPNVTN